AVQNMVNTQGGYIVKQKGGHCEIVEGDTNGNNPVKEAEASWGPFASQSDAIARRVGLIRSGKCQPE
ncbi:MAG: hypothetical protein ACOC3E_02535, partial [Cyanobacteriota bacterium]